MTASVEARQLYQPCDFARIISWHPESVRRAIREGRIKAVRISRGLRIPAEEVARICKNGLPSTPDQGEA